jgi:glycosyltransferase involved in cell wall biosynthesis
MKMLHILYSGLGGHGNVFFSLVKADAGNDHQYEAIFNGIEDVKQEYIDECKRHDIPWHFVKKKAGFDIGYYRRMVKLVRKTDADLIFLHSSGYIMPAWLGRVFGKGRKPIIVRETQANHLKTRQDRFWLAVAMFVAKKIVFLSDAYHAEIKKKLGWFCRPPKIEVIPNGLDLEFYRPLPPATRQEFSIGMQSRLVPIKDHVTMLEAFALLLRSGLPQPKTLHLKIAGDGEEMRSLRGKAASLQLGDTVQFTGMLPEAELRDLLWSLDIYVHASLGETMSTAIMQAMACGLPIIASDVRGIQNMIEDGKTGILVPVRDARAMSIAMQQLINDGTKREELGTGARRYAEEHFSANNMAAAYRALFLSVIKA